MTDPIVRLDQARLRVDPGGQVSLVVTVFNPGTVVEGYDVDVVASRPIPWASVQPSEVSVYPQQEATSTVVFAPPSGPDAPGGAVPFGVRVRSQVGDGSTVVEGDLEVGSVAGLHARLTPVTSTGRWGGRHVLSVANAGNAPARLRLVVDNPDQALGFLVAPPVLDVPMGGEAVARIKVRTRRPTLRGTPQRLPFQVVCDPGDGAPAVPSAVSSPSRPVVDGAFQQKPILTRGMVTLTGLLAVALIGGLAFLLTRGGAQTHEELGPPGVAPGGFEVQSASTDHIVLRWQKLNDVDGYLISVLDENGVPVSDPVEVEPNQSFKGIEAPAGTRRCFTLVAFRGEVKDDLVSPPTDQVCGDTLPGPEPSASGSSGDTGVATPTDSASSGGTAGGTLPPGATDPPDAFVAVLSITDQEASAEISQETFFGAGVATKRLSTDEVQMLNPSTGAPPGAGLWLVYVDGADQAAATQACSEAASTLSAAGVPAGNAGCLVLEVSGAV